MLCLTKDIQCYTADFYDSYLCGFTRGKESDQCWQNIKKLLYIRNLKPAHLTPVFRLHNIHLVFSTYVPTKIEMDIVYGKTDLIASF